MVGGMAVIELAKQDFDHLLGEEKRRDTLEEHVSMLGVLWEDHGDNITVEVEPNRPDLLSVEGLGA